MLKKIALAVALACASQAYAADNTYFDNFTPLTSSQTTALPAATPIKLSSPLFSQLSIADRATENLQVPGSNQGSWDMIDADPSGRYLFAPFETGSAGVMRYDTQTGIAETIVAPGTQGFVSGDASRTTPWGGYLTAEESWGTGSSKGRLFEVLNPTTIAATTSTTNTNFVRRSVIPRVAHEGLAFDSANNLYFVDELNGGTIYKYVSANPTATNGNDYFATGQTFALRVGAGGQFEGTNTNAASLTGSLSWEAITNTTGGALAGSSVVLSDGTIDGRTSADLATVKSTGYNRPEDMEIQTLANGNQLVYFTTTDSDNDSNAANGYGRVYNMNLATNTVSLFMDSNTIDLATGLAVGGALGSPDNLSIDANGNIYIIEDQNGAVNDDIWFANDINKDGDLLDAGEGVARWASNGTPGSEFTGLYFSKVDPNIAYVNIQHPNDGNDRMIQITAVPEPETYAMLLAGLGLMGGVARRRNRKA
jgi:hypothetical protein